MFRSPKPSLIPFYYVLMEWQKLDSPRIFILETMELPSHSFQLILYIDLSFSSGNLYIWVSLNTIDLILGLSFLVIFINFLL